MAEVTVEQARAAAKRAYEAGDVAAARRWIAEGKRLEAAATSSPERGMLGSAIDWMAGVNRREDIPQAMQARLGLSPAQSAQMVALLATTASDDRLMRGIMKIEPSAQFDKDEYGNLIAVMPKRDAEGNEVGRTRFYPNPRGLDMVDLMQGSGALALGSGVGAAAKLLGLPMTGLLGGATLGATEAALTEGASSQLTDTPYQLSDIPYGAAGGAAAGKAADILEGFLRKAGGSGTAFVNGQLTQQARDALRAAGVDPGSVTQEMAESIMRRTRSAVDPVEAGRLAASETLPIPVPLTRGEVSGSAGQQLFEDMALKGAYGESAAALVRGRRAEQQAAIQQNVGAIQERLAGAAPLVGAAGEGGAAAQAALAARRAEERAAAEGLYTAARQAGPAQVQDAASVSGQVRGALETFNPRTAPDAYAFADDFDELLTSGADVDDLFAWRSQLTTASQSPTPDGAAMGRMVTAFDDAMSDAVNRALLTGDASAVEKWSKAITNYKDFAQTWKSKGGVLNALTEQVTRDGDRVLKVAPEAASNYIFGAGGSKLISQPALARDLLVLKAKLPEDQWGMLRQEAFLNLIQKGSGGVRDGEQVFSGVKFLKAIEDLNAKNPSTAKALFTPQERALLKQFASVAARATGGAINASNSASAAAGLLQQLAASVGGTNAARFAGQLVDMKMLRNAYGTTRGFQSISDLTTARPTLAPVAGAGGAAAAGPTLQQPTAEQIERTTGVPFGVQ